MQKLVSVITPCYNGENYVKRFLDSILNQTYRNIELIFINDGSTDRTEKIVMNYIPVFEKQGMTLIYMKQPNAGQAAALNEGLKLFSGEYFTWPDSDDYLDKTSIEKRVIFLESNSQYGFVRSNAYYVDSKTLKPTKRIAVLPRRFDSQLFEGLLKGQQFVLNGCYLVRASAFSDVNPNHTIEFSFIGQNYQMLLPLAYKYSCGFIDEPLFYYVNTPNSHSRRIRNYQEASARCNEFYRLLHSICNKIGMVHAEREKYSQLIERYSISALRYLALDYRQPEEFQKYHGRYLKQNRSVWNKLIPCSIFYQSVYLQQKIKTILKNIIKQVIQ